MGIFDTDPKYRQLKKIRDSGYKGPLDQDLRKVRDVGKWVAKQQAKNKK
jgi:hypothetical protein